MLQSGFSSTQAPKQYNDSRVDTAKALVPGLGFAQNGYGTMSTESTIITCE